jgi:propanol-preferring alcohol dehydrogenase
MKAMILKRISNVLENPSPLEPVELPVPVPAEGELLVRLSVCGVCHTELDEIEGRTPPPVLPVVPGHQAVGIVESAGPGSDASRIGQRVGIAWIHSACGRCEHCQAGNENLCRQFRATGRDADGGYAQYMTMPERYAFPIPDRFSDAEAAPLLCAGAIGYRSLRLTGLRNGRSLGLTGFGASAHIVLKLAAHVYPESNIFVFARSEAERAFARELGAVWAGDIGEEPTRKIDCIIDSTPVWRPVVAALACLSPGGRLVINAIRKEEVDQDQLLELDYPTHLWEEKEIKSVANVTAADVREFLAAAAAMALRPEVQEYPLEAANRALVELKTGRIRGAKVLRID